jgi:protein-arginine kinase
MPSRKRGASHHRQEVQEEKRTMKKSEKEEIVAEVREKISRAKGMFFTDFSGITVEQATELRSEFRKLGVDYKVVKNTLARKALESVTGYDAVYNRYCFQLQRSRDTGKNHKEVPRQECQTFLQSLRDRQAGVRRVEAG